MSDGAAAPRPWDGWSQTDSEVSVNIAVDASITTGKLKVKMESKRLAITVNGEEILDKELSGRIVVDDSYWSLEGSGENRMLIVTLAKKQAAKKWGCLLQEEEDTLPEKDACDADFDIMNLEHDDDNPERVEEQLENEKKLDLRYAKLKAEKGLDDEDTLATFFALFDNCIQLYRLNKLSDYLEEVVPSVRKRSDKYKLKGVQALAFVRWKQSRFREALPLFHEMEEILGKGAALCENIAHTYNSLGDYEKAEDYFRQALMFIEQEHGSNKGNRGGVLLGLGLVRDRLGKHREALTVCQKAYEFYKERAHGAPASLQAKAGISCAKINAKLGNLPKAEGFIREAVHMYEVTCGETSPLTASAYHELGKCLWAQRKREDAQKALKRGYELETMKDAFDLITVLEIHNILMDTHLKETENIQRGKFKDYFKVVDYTIGRVRKLTQDGNAAVYYKAGAELLAWGGRYQEAKALFDESIVLLTVETSTDCTSLISSCKDMLAFCDRNLAGLQNSPMDFDVPDKAGSSSADGNDAENTTGGVQIEEIFEDAEEGGVATSSDNATSSHAAAATAAQYEYRVATPEDFAAVALLGVSCGREPLLSDEASFRDHLANSGRGLCWVAERDDELAGFAFCSADGIFGHLLQLLAASGDDTELLQTELVERCTAACRRDLGLPMHAPVPVGKDDGLFERLGWDFCYRVYARRGDERPQKKTRLSDESTAPQRSTGATAAPEPRSSVAVASSAATATQAAHGATEAPRIDPPPAPPRPPEPEEPEGPDPEAPDARKDDELADVSLQPANKITKFAWDQSDKFVSVYVDFPGAGSLDASAVECVFKSHGVLLTVADPSGKKHWWKVPNLGGEVDVGGCKKTVKADSVVLKLKKLKANEKWTDLNDDKDRYQQKRQFRINHGDLKGATTEELLADMYQNANDDDRAGLRDAMRVNREKRAEESKK